MADDPRTWLRHPETGGYFHCPDGAVEGWEEIGWQRSDPPPPEPNPAVADRLALERELAEKAEAEAKPARKTTAAKPAKTAEPEES